MTPGCGIVDGILTEDVVSRPALPTGPAGHVPLAANIFFVCRLFSPQIPSELSDGWVRMPICL